MNYSASQLVKIIIAMSTFEKQSSQGRTTEKTTSTKGKIKITTQ